jgi:hypothetical protein
MTPEAETIEKIAAAVAARMAPTIPIAVALWDTAACGAYLNRSPESFRERIAPRPDFPRAIRIPSETGGRGHPLWPAREVIQWASKYRERT